MPRYQYKGRTKQGIEKKGWVESESSESVVAQLLANDITPVDIQVEKEKFSIKLFTSSPWKEKVPLEDLIIFSHQMYTLTKAGVPIARVIAVLEESVTNDSLREALNSIQKRLNEGKVLSSALEEYPEIFSSLMINLVRVGEKYWSAR